MYIKTKPLWLYVYMYVFSRCMFFLCILEVCSFCLFAAHECIYVCVCEYMCVVLQSYQWSSFSSPHAYAVMSFVEVTRYLLSQVGEERLSLLSEWILQDPTLVNVLEEDDVTILLSRSRYRMPLQSNTALDKVGLCVSSRRGIFLMTTPLRLTALHCQSASDHQISDIKMYTCAYSCTNVLFISKYNRGFVVFDCCLYSSIHVEFDCIILVINALSVQFHSTSSLCVIHLMILSLNASLESNAENLFFNAYE